MTGACPTALQVRHTPTPHRSIQPRPCTLGLFFRDQLAEGSDSLMCCYHPHCRRSASRTTAQAAAATSSTTTAAADVAAAAATIGEQLLG